MIAITKHHLQCAAFVAVIATGFSAAAGPDPTGLWYDHTGRGAVEITHCGEALCGHLVWLKNISDNEVCGRQIIGGVRAVAGGKWDNGWIYDPEKDAKYDVEITPMSSGKLKVMGYAGTKLFSETMIWQRAPDTLKKCNQPQATAATAAPNPIAQAESTSETPAIAPQAAREEAKLEKSQTGTPAKASSRDCKLRFSSVEITFPCID
jgi:uncharacterized protein (DUF2147 family)